MNGTVSVLEHLGNGNGSPSKTCSKPHLAQMQVVEMNSGCHSLLLHMACVQQQCVLNEHVSTLLIPFKLKSRMLLFLF